MAKRRATTNMADRFDDVSEQVESRFSDVTERVRSSMQDMNISEATIPDAFERAPKFISPTVHAWLDVAVTGYFLGVGAWCATRGKAGAATAAFVNAGMVAGVSLLTDYKGNGRKPVNFKLHGTMDALQATTAALGPVLHGFADEPESAFFYGQALNEVAVIAATDWDAGMPGQARNRRAA